MAELDSFPNQTPQDSDEVVAAHDSNGDGTLDDTVNWTWSGMKAALDGAGYARTDQPDQEFKGSITSNKGGINTRWTSGEALGRFAMEWQTLDSSSTQATRLAIRGGSNSADILFLSGASGGEATQAVLFNGGQRFGVGGVSAPSHVVDAGGTIRAQDKLLTDFSDPTVFSAREVKSGTSAPSDSEGKNGDIYIQTN